MLSGMLCTVACTLLITLVVAKDKEVVLRIEPETLVETFKSFMSSEYVKKIVDEFAVKAADHFIKEIKKSTTNANEKPNVTSKRLLKTFGAEKPRRPSLVASAEQSKTSREMSVQRGILQHTDKQLNDDFSSEEKQSEKLLALMMTPHPDGDNLEEEAILTEIEEPERKHNDKPRMIYKINGKHYRAYDFIWK